MFTLLLAKLHHLACGYNIESLITIKWFYLKADLFSTQVQTQEYWQLNFVCVCVLECVLMSVYLLWQNIQNTSPVRI